MIITALQMTRAKGIARNYGGKTMDNDKIQLFEDKKIRTAWDEEEKEV